MVRADLIKSGSGQSQFFQMFWIWCYHRPQESSIKMWLRLTPVNISGPETQLLF